MAYCSSPIIQPTFQVSGGTGLKTMENQDIDFKVRIAIKASEVVYLGHRGVDIQW
jgi:hypothetical protein